MGVAAPTRGVGELLRDWRRRRRLSQLDLALEAEVSTRHLSFVETGRSKPSREFVLHVAQHLEVPLRERNHLLLAAGYAPLYGQTPLDAEEMGPVRDAIDKLLTSHEPYPAVIVDGRWNIVSSNRPLQAMLDGVAPHLLAAPANSLRVCMHPEGLAPRIVNFGEYSGHLLARLRRRITTTADPELLALGEELRRYPGVSVDRSVEVTPAQLLFFPFVMRLGDQNLTFFSTITTFGTALDITLAELAIESLFPADAATVAAVRAAWGP